MNPAINDSKICSDYTLYQFDRDNGIGSGGGVLIGLSNSLPFIVSNIHQSIHRELISVYINILDFSSTLCCVIQRPCIKNINNIIQQYYAQTKLEIFFVGDFNLQDIDWTLKPFKTTEITTNIRLV